MILLWLIPASLAAELLVPTNHATVADALGVASTGDTIRLVQDHTESVNVDVDGIQMLGDAGVTLTASGSYALDIPSGVSVTVRDLTITGGGIYPCMQVRGDVIIEDAVFTGCDNGNGGALHVPDPGTATVRRTTFTGNTANRGAHIYGYGPSLVIEDCVLEDGVGASEGAVHSTGSNALEVRRSVFQNNRAGDDGGALSLTGASATIEDTLFEGNDAVNSGGAVFVSGLGVLQIRRSRFLSNTAARAAALDISSAGDVLVESSELRCNSGGGNGGGGGAVRVYDSTGKASTVFRGVLFAGNQSVGVGGGAYLTGGPATFDFTTFVANTGTGGQALYASSTASVVVTNSVIAHHVGTAAEASYGWSSDYNVWFANGTDLLGGGIGPNSQVGVNPTFRDHQGNCLTDSLWSDSGSPVLGTADPAQVDPDPGAFGGPTPVCAPDDVWLDDDGDSFGDAARPSRDCTPYLADYVSSGADCDDGDSLVFPGATEQCNGADDDCDGSIDEEVCEGTDTGSPPGTTPTGDTGSPAAPTGVTGVTADTQASTDTAELADPTTDAGPGPQPNRGTTAAAGCRCASAQGGPSPSLLPIALFLLWRRRPLSPSSA